MSISDKIIQLNQVKQEIKQAIENKGVAMSGVPFTNYPLKINEISGGGGGSPLLFTDDLEKAQKVKEVFAMSDKVNNLNNVWEDYKRTPELKYDLALTRVAENQDLAGIPADIYIGSSDLTTLYNDCVNGTVNDDDLYVTSTLFVGYSEYVDTAFQYYGDISSFFGVPFPIYSFGFSSGILSFGAIMAVFLVADLTPLEMGLGISLIKPYLGFNNTESIKIYSKYSSYKQGLIADLSKMWYPGILYNIPLYIDDTVITIEDGAFSGWVYNNYPLVIPNSVVTIGEQVSFNEDYAGAFSHWETNDKQIVFGSNLKHIGLLTFAYWSSNNQPLVLPEGLESIGVRAFEFWTANNQPLVIPNSVTSIGLGAFTHWTANDKPLVIGNSVTSIGDYAFSYWTAVPYVEIQAITPPTLVSATAFEGQNNAPIYVPDGSVDDYKTATNWVDLADRIFPISDRGQ